MLRKATLIGAAILALPAIAAAQMRPADYVAKAGAGDLYERQSSQLVLQTTKSTAVRRFANMMVADHAKTTQEVAAAARAVSLPEKPPVLEPRQAEMIRALTAATGPARDRLYMQQQATAHQEALALHRDYSQSGQQPPLKAAATRAVPIVEHHIEMLGKTPAM